MSGTTTTATSYSSVLAVVGSWLYNRGDYPKVMQVMQESPLINRLVSHELPMSEIQAGFDALDLVRVQKSSSIRGDEPCE